ncbi:hypothetical protein Bca4012_039905 [Brassica carinata]
MNFLSSTSTFITSLQQTSTTLKSTLTPMVRLSTYVLDATSHLLRMQFEEARKALEAIQKKHRRLLLFFQTSKIIASFLL